MLQMNALNIVYDVSSIFTYFVCIVSWKGPSSKDGHKQTYNPEIVHTFKGRKSAAETKGNGRLTVLTEKYAKPMSHENYWLFLDTNTNSKREPANQV